MERTQLPQTQTENEMFNLKILNSYLHNCNIHRLQF